LDIGLARGFGFLAPIENFCAMMTWVGAILVAAEVLAGTESAIDAIGITLCQKRRNDFRGTKLQSELNSLTY
jgi:hypothetical protein